MCFADEGLFWISIDFVEAKTIFRSLVTLSLLLTLITIILSAYIRLAEVGIGCEDWPTCYAQLSVETEKKGVTVLTEDGRNMAHYWARVTHRYIASILGLFIVAVFALSLRQNSVRTTGIFVPITIFSIMVFLSLLGYYTPTRSNPLITMGNLLGGMALLGLLWWLMQRDTDAAEVAVSTSRFRPLAIAALCLVSLQIILGGWSSANYASANCPQLLQCEPALSLNAMQSTDVFNPLRHIPLNSTGQVVRNESLAMLSISHRLFALLTAGYLAWMMRKLKSEAHLRTNTLALSVLSISQLAIGVSMIWLEIPLLMLALHNALAAGLLLACVNLLHRLTPPGASRSPG